jgi:peptide chain release factor 1
MELNQFQDLQTRYNEIEQKLTSAQLNVNDRQSLQKEYSFLSNIITKYNEIQSLKELITQSQQQAQQTNDEELKQMFVEEIAELELKFKNLSKELEDALFPGDEYDKASAFIEIRAGAGGQEAALFVGDLLRMYSNYALKMNWTASLVDYSETDLKGYRELIIHIKGKGAYGHLKFESGVHRVQRVPLTETAGRVHTSTVTVAVFPEIEEEGAIQIDPADLRIDVYRAGGAGGQHVNKTESAVRITHIPTGVVVACQEDRSQHKNKERAMKMLKSRIIAAAREKQELEMQQNRKEQVGRGMRAEKVRTYNFPQNRVTDHQVELTLTKLDFVMEGALDEIIDALRDKEREERRKKPIVKD